MGWLIPEGAQVDWQAWATFGAGLVNAIAIVIAAFLAKLGLEGFFTQRKKETAFNCLEISYRAQQLLLTIKSNNLFFDFLSGSTDVETHHQYITTRERLLPVVSEILELSPKVRLIFGPEASNKFKNINLIIAHTITTTRDFVSANLTGTQHKMPSNELYDDLILNLDKNILDLESSLSTKDLFSR